MPARHDPHFANDEVRTDFARHIYGCDAGSAEERERRDREINAELALRDCLTRQFGNYKIDGAGGVIQSRGVSINYRELARTAVASVDLTEGRSLRGSDHAATAA